MFFINSQIKSLTTLNVVVPIPVLYLFSIIREKNYFLSVCLMLNKNTNYLFAGYVHFKSSSSSEVCVYKWTCMGHDYYVYNNIFNILTTGVFNAYNIFSLNNKFATISLELRRLLKNLQQQKTQNCKNKSFIQLNGESLNMLYNIF